MRVLDRSTLNRTTLARQWLLDRQRRSAREAVAHLVGLQAQEPQEPYVGLWSRLAPFRPATLVADLEQRRLVRTLLMRRTMHLVTAQDCLALRPIHDPMLRSRMRGTLYSRVAPRLPGVDPDELAEAGRPLFAEQPRTLGEVGRMVGDRWPDAPARDLGDALSSLVPLVQVPPRGVWRVTAPARNTTIASWLGSEPAEPDGALDELVLRYLRAFGPATGSDLRAWSGLSGLPGVVRRLRPQLIGYRDERGRELLDTEDGRLTPGDAPAPVRLLPAFDNVVLGFADRSRMIDDEHRGLSVRGTRFVLVDGRVGGAWTSRESDGVVEVSVTLFAAAPSRLRDEVVHEAEELARFLGDGAEGRVALSAPS